MLDFSNGATEKETYGLIPKGAVLFATINHRGTKISQNTGRRMFDLEFTINNGQPYAGKKIWKYVMDPADPDLNLVAREGAGDPKERAQKTIDMSSRQIAYMLEAAFGIDNPSDPAKAEHYKIDSDLQGLHGKTVAIKVSATDGSDGYDPKNEIVDFPSPNPNRSNHNLWKKLSGGDHNIQAGQGQAQSQPSFGFAQQKSTGQAPAETNPFDNGTGGSGLNW